MHLNRAKSIIDRLRAATRGRLRSIRAKILLMTVTIVIAAFCLNGLVGFLAIDGMVQDFFDILKNRSDEFVAVIAQNSARSRDRLVSVFEENARLKGENLIKKDSRILQASFEENAYSAVRSHLQNAFDFDPSILIASFIVVEGGEIKAWQYIDRSHPQGLPLPIVYDRTSSSWVVSDHGAQIRVADPSLVQILNTKASTVHKITIGAGGTEAAELPAYEATIPILQGGATEVGAESGQTAMAFLRYVISLEELTKTAQAEQRELDTLISLQKVRANNVMEQTVRDVKERIIVTFLLLFFSSAAVVVAAVAVAMLLAGRLARPLQLLSSASEAIASGDYSRAVNVASSDEIGTLARSFDAMRRKVKDFTEQLQQMVEERTCRLNEALQTVTDQGAKIREIMHTIDEGIFTIDDHLKVEADYSLHLETLYHYADRPGGLGGMPAANLLLQNTHESQDEADRILDCLSVCVGENQLSWQLNHDILPKRLVYDTPAGQRTFEFHFSPMVRGGVVRRLLVSVRDLTKEVALEASIERQKIEANRMLVAVAEILVNPRPALVRVLKEADRRLSTMERMSKDDLDLKAAMIELHSIKGAARSMQFARLTEKTHVAEGVLQEALRGRGLDHGSFLAELAKAREELDYLRNVAHEVLHIKDEDPSAADGENLFMLLAEPLREVERLCRDKGIAIDEIAISDQVVAWQPELLRDLAGVARHALVNAVDHGYFTPRSKGWLASDERVKLSILTRQQDETLHLVFADGGFGFNRESIRQRAEHLNLSYKNDDDLVRLLLIDGFSTSERVTRLSGRGSGLAALRAFAEKWGGSIHLRDNQPRGSVIEITIPVAAIS